MATIIRFPEQRAPVENRAAPAGPGMVIILPVVRVERRPDEPSDGLESGSRSTSGRKRRRRASRS
jgi:hypothetical protein